MSAHDAIAYLPPFKIEFWPLQAIFDDLVLIFYSKLASKVSTKERFHKLSELCTILCFS
jgi:hypothetical protein